MEYSDISSVLKRYSFEEKMRVAQIHSRKTIIPSNQRDVETLRELIHPWELETFVLHAVKEKEWKLDDFEGKNAKIFIDIINAIRNVRPTIVEKIQNEDIVTWILTSHASVQFDSQEFFMYKLYRYNYFFSFSNEKINIPTLFKEKFGCDYYNYALLGDILTVAFSIDNLAPEIYKEIFKRFLLPIANLTLTRQEYSDEIDKITDDTQNYLYCLRPSYSYPFISEKDVIYCPLPHLLYRATTSSMMFRLTDRNNGLISTIGKEVYEDYLYTLIKDSAIFDEVHSEEVYILKRTEHRTVDVMARKDNTYVFFDSKSFTPKSSLRTFSQEALDDDIRRLAESICQVYKHIRKKFPKEYCYFSEEPKESFEIFGLVVIQEQPHILARKIYPKVAELLKMSQNSDEYRWLYTHVGLVTIYNIERFCFTQSNMCPVLQRIKSEGEMQHAWLTKGAESNATFLPFTEFRDKITEDMRRIMYDLIDSNIQK